MSLPTPPVLKCEKCSFSGSLGSYPYLVHKYRLRDGTEAYVDSRQEWCHNCSDFTEVEYFPDLDAARMQLQQAAETLRRYTSLTPMAVLRRLNPFFGYRRNLSNHEFSLKRCQETYAFVSSRKALPKCLTCGSTEHTPLTFPPHADGERVFTNVTHPGCGGRFIIDARNRHRISMSPQITFYDSEGNRL